MEQNTEFEVDGEFDVESPRRVMTRSMARAGRRTHLPRQGIIRPSRMLPRPDLHVEGSGTGGGPVPVTATMWGGPVGTTANAAMASRRLGVRRSPEMLPRPNLCVMGSGTSVGSEHVATIIHGDERRVVTEAESTSSTSR